MPRDLPLGNGDFLVNFDARYQLRDVFYPNVGLENHTIGEPSRFGIWVDGQFSWSGDDGWQRAINYELETLVGDTTLEHPKLGVRLRCRDTVDFDRNIYFKEVTVEDLVGRDRQVRLFQHFDANLYGNDTGDSAYYDPRSQALVHYKGRRYFLISGSIGGSSYGLTSFAIGQKDAPGKEGTWRDAEDGELSRNPVAQGSSDSVGMTALAVPAHGSATGGIPSTSPDTARSPAASSSCAATSSRARATCCTNTTPTARSAPPGTRGRHPTVGSSCRSRRTRPDCPSGRSGSTTTATATSSSSARCTESSCGPAPISWRRTASPAPSCPRRRSICGKSGVGSMRSPRRRSGRASPRRATSPSRSGSTSSRSATPSRRRRSARPPSPISGTRTAAASCERSPCSPMGRS